MLFSVLKTEVLILQQASDALEGLVKTRMWRKWDDDDTCQVTNRLLGPIYQSFWFEQNTSKFCHEAEQIWGAPLESTTVHAPQQSVSQVDSGQTLVNTASFYALWLCSFHSHPEPFSGHALHQVNAPDHVFWQWIIAEWESGLSQFTHDPIIKIFKKDL